MGYVKYNEDDVNIVNDRLYDINNQAIKKSINIDDSLYKKLIYLTDLFLLDIKCINDEKAKELTGVSNKKELAFAEYLSSIGKLMWIRQVLVPGFTDDKEDLLKLKEFISSLNNVEKIEILPYHDLGKFKWEKLGCIYELEGFRTANNDDVKRAKEILGI